MKQDEICDIKNKKKIIELNLNKLMNQLIARTIDYSKKSKSKALKTDKSDKSEKSSKDNNKSDSASDFKVKSESKFRSRCNRFKNKNKKCDYCDHSDHDEFICNYKN